MKEAEIISEYVPINYTVATLMVIIVLSILIIRIAPTAINWFNQLRSKANIRDSLIKTVKDNSSSIELINQKMGRDYARLNKMEQSMEKQQKFMEDSLEERELILKSMLGIIQGLQEIGANGPTKEAEKEIQKYLLKKSHKSIKESMDE